ncbi:hypothetical protein C8R45DRAFT_947572 [Mycena sanguinolenta]|nr:hypothetical protein C8R45DRAFT_947572 [Mycena sanguinolenta]
MASSSPSMGRAYFVSLPATMSSVFTATSSSTMAMYSVTSGITLVTTRTGTLFLASARNVLAFSPTNEWVIYKNTYLLALPFAVKMRLKDEGKLKEQGTTKVQDKKLKQKSKLVLNCFRPTLLDLTMKSKSVTLCRMQQWQGRYAVQHKVPIEVHRPSSWGAWRSIRTGGLVIRPLNEGD